MADTFGTAAKQFISAADNVDALMHLLKRLPLNNVKRFIVDELDKLKQGERREIIANSVPFDYVLPGDVSGHIISYVPLQTSIKKVSKSMNALLAKEEGRKKWNEPHHLDGLFISGYKTVEEAMAAGQNGQNWRDYVLNKRNEVSRLKEKMNAEIDELRRRHNEVILIEENNVKSLTDTFVEWDAEREIEFAGELDHQICKHCMDTYKVKYMLGCDEWNCNQRLCCFCALKYEGNRQSVFDAARRCSDKRCRKHQCWI